MKKYRLKINTPWGEKGSIFEKVGSYWHDSYPHLTRHFSSDPQLYPHLFEPIEEKSEVERIVDWLLKNRLPNLGHIEPCAQIIAEKLLSAGLDVNKLEVENG